MYLDQKKQFAAAFVMAFSHLNGFAQTPPTPNYSPPTVEMVDPVGVAMNSGRPTFSILPVKIGPAADPLVFTESFEGGLSYPTSGWYGYIQGSRFGSPYSVGDMVVTVPSGSEQLMPVGDGVNYTSRTGRGGTLTISSSYVYQYIDRDGVVYDFDTGYNPAACGDHYDWITVQGEPALYEQVVNGACAELFRITYPSGLIVTLGAPYYYPSTGGNGYQSAGLVRYASRIMRSDGFQLVAQYLNWQHSDNLDNPFAADPNPLSQVVAYNAATDYCDSTATSCVFSQNWPVATMSWSGPAFNDGDTRFYILTDNAGNQTRYTERIVQGASPDPLTGNDTMYKLLVGVKPPSSPTDDTVSYSYANQRFCYSYDDGFNGLVTNCSAYIRDGLVQSASIPSGIWQYSYVHDAPMAPVQSMEPGRYGTTVTRPDGYTMSGDFNSLTGYIYWMQGTSGQLNYDVNYLTDPNVVLNSVDSEGRYFSYTSDGRSNLLTKQQNPNSSGPILMQASYSTTCANVVTCNKPNWIIDANNNETDYVYDPTHGGVLTETGPADANGIRPQKRYTYVQRTPWLKNASGGYAAEAPIWKLNSLSYCRTTAAASSGGCNTPSDEVVITYDYGPDAGPNNLLLRGQVISADGTSLRTCYGYDVFGSKISETSPGAGLASCP